MRSFLFAPANHPRRAEKALQLGADVVILDLEDAVAVAEKPAARQAAVAALQVPRTALGYVRINGIDTPWCRDDIGAVVGPWLDGLVLPKAESAEAVRKVDELITIAERSAGLAPGALDLMPIIETALGVEAVGEIARASTRVRRLAFGGGDYTHDLNLVWTESEIELSYARARLAHASRVAGIEPPVDTVVLQVKDAARFLQSARNGRGMGFFGKLCIHPDQLAPCHEAFTPSAAEIAQAQAIVAAFADAEARGLASIQVQGVFVDYPVARKAQRVLAIAARAAKG
jgi:citrate lyase subunit beta / citryl-CoA lyase